MLRQHLHDALLVTIARKSRIFIRFLSTNPFDSLSCRGGFGSFHSEDIEDIIRKPRGLYMPPVCLNDITANTHYSVLESFEDAVALFNITPEFTFINHGAFGAALLPLAIEAERFRWVSYYILILFVKFLHQSIGAGRIVNCNHCGSMTGQLLLLDSSTQFDNFAMCPIENFYPSLHTQFGQ